MNATRITVNLRTDTVDKLKVLAKKRGATFTEAIGKLLDLVIFLQEQEDKGNRVLLETANGLVVVERNSSCTK